MFKHESGTKNESGSNRDIMATDKWNISFWGQIKKEIISLFNISTGRKGRKDSRSAIILQIMKDVLAGIILGIVLNYIGGLFYVGIKEITTALIGSDAYTRIESGLVDVTPIKFTKTDLIMMILVEYFIVGLNEELFYRGFLIKEFEGHFLKKIKNKMKKGTQNNEQEIITPRVLNNVNIKVKIYVVLLSSVLFGLYHVVPILVVPPETTLVFLPYFFLIGVLFGIFYFLFSKRLIPLIVAHGTFNSLILIMMLFS
ncbi:MAG: lysostaphin resistance A-like protein [Promethearchaeota archaeon]